LYQHAADSQLRVEQSILKTISTNQGGKEKLRFQDFFCSIWSGNTTGNTFKLGPSNCSLISGFGLQEISSADQKS
jgi:hypothetical protein